MRPQMEQERMPVDQRIQYHDLLRGLLQERRSGLNRASQGVAVVSAHRGAGVTYTCNALLELVNRAVVPTRMYQPAAVRMFGAGSHGAMADYEVHTARSAGVFIEASQLAITVDIRELTLAGNEFGAVVAKSLEPRVLRSPTLDGRSVYERLYPLSTEWAEDTDCRKECLQTVGEMFRLVLLDVPSLRESAEIRSVAPLADGVVVVVEANKTTKKQLRRLTETIEDEGGTILGYLLNKRTYPIPEPIYRWLEKAGLA